MMMSTTLVAAASGLATAAPQLTFVPSTGLQTVLRGIAVVLIAVLLILLLVKNLKLGRGGGMGGQGRIGAMTIIITVLVSAMLMDVALFVTGLNWTLNLVYEGGQWVQDFLDSTPSTGTGTGSVDIV